MKGGVFTLSQQALPNRVECCVIGSGPAGATLARALGRAGRQVLVLEEGPDLVGAALTQRDGEMYDQLYQNRGGRTTADLSISVLGGRALGGGSVINACDVVPCHPSVLRIWQRKYGLSDYGPEQLAQDEQAALLDLSANRPVEHADASGRPDKPTALNRNNRVLVQGCQALGWRGEIMLHNRVGCAGLGTCLLGCPLSAKRNARMVQIPQALEAGVPFFLRARAKRIEHLARDEQRITVAGLDPRGYHEQTQHTLLAKQVFLAAGAISSASLLLRSGLGNEHVGRRFLLQPQLPVAAIFPAPVRLFQGIPQSFAVTQFEQIDHPEHGFWGFRIEAIGATPGMVSTMLPAVGAVSQKQMQRYADLAGALLLHPDTAMDPSRLVVDGDGRLHIEYSLSDEQKHRLRASVEAAVRVYLAAGASQVIVPQSPGLHFAQLSDLPKVSNLSLKPATLPLISAHQMGTVPMGDSPKRAACSPDGELYGTPGVFVVDSSLFPSSPSSHIMAPVLTVAGALARRFLSRNL